MTEQHMDRIVLSFWFYPRMKPPSQVHPPSSIAQSRTRLEAATVMVSGTFAGTTLQLSVLALPEKTKCRP